MTDHFRNFKNAAKYRCPTVGAAVYPRFMLRFFGFGWLIIGISALAACVRNPSAATNRSCRQQVRAYAKALRTTPVPTPGADSLLLSPY